MPNLLEISGMSGRVCDVKTIEAGLQKYQSLKLQAGDVALKQNCICLVFVLDETWECRKSNV
jgi:hypothetical protein